MAGGKVRRPQVDKGWAWVVMLATFGCHLIIGGLQHTSGLVRYALQENVQKENLHYVSWLGSVYSGLISLTGPLSSLMVYNLGCRATVLIGATLETVGFVCSYLITDEKLLFLTYSLFAGSGSGITYSAAMIVVGYNFDKYLALASGLSVTGQGLGLLVFSILLNFCFEYYGLKGTFLLMACLTLQKLVFGSLLRPSTIEMAQTKRFWHKEPSSYPDGDIELEVRKETTSVMIKKALSALSLNSHQSSRPDYERVCTTEQRMPEHHNSALSIGTNKDFKTSHEFHKGELTYSISNIEVIKTEEYYPSIHRNFKFFNFLFCLMCASTAEGMVYLLAPSYFISNGSSPDEASKILSLVGVSSTLTRPLMGFLANSNVADIFLLFLAPYGILGVFTLFLPFYVHLLAGRVIFAFLFGLYNCSVYALLNKLTLRITGIENMAAAFGLEMFIWGMTGILGTPLADNIVRWTGSFSSAFVFAGTMYIMCSVAAFFLPMSYEREVTTENEPAHV